MRKLIVPVLLLAASSAFAQTDHATRFMENCQRNGGDDERYCEVRNFTVPAARALNVDGQQNGGITVHGWDRADVVVTAMVQANGETVNDAQAIAKSINIVATAGQIRSDGPSMEGRHQSWSVSYEVWAPRGTDLTLVAMNGGISVDNVNAKLDLRTVNGGLSLTDVAGDVRGTTSNGGITADLSGDRWQGAGLDLRTSNGGVKLTVPANYSAQLETGTVNGHLNVDFPVTVQGSFTRHLSTQLGGGGAPIHAETTNGGVTIKRK
jgi:DUF4097 and DUF4098 domain-containing protein YvlB